MYLKLDSTDLSLIANYHLPQFNEIPDVGLYLNQTATYINKYLEPIFKMPITESMISNYVKKRLIDNPIKKQYSREMIAYLLFIALCKSVSSLDDLQLIISLQKKDYSVEKAYDYFKNEFESILYSVFSLEKRDISKEGENTLEELLSKIITTVAHKIYVDMAFKQLRESNEKDDRK